MLQPLARRESWIGWASSSASRIRMIPPLLSRVAQPPQNLSLRAKRIPPAMPATPAKSEAWGSNFLSLFAVCGLRSALPSAGDCFAACNSSQYPCNRAIVSRLHGKAKSPCSPGDWDCLPCSQSTETKLLPKVVTVVFAHPLPFAIHHEQTSQGEEEC